MDRPLSLNARAAAIARAMARDGGVLRIGVSRDGAGALRLDCGHGARGSTEAGLALARATLGGLATVALHPSAPLPWAVAVRTAHPALACLGSQYAGWTFEGTGGAALLGSGPARLLSQADAVAVGVEHGERASVAVLALEGPEPPPEGLSAEVAAACGVEPARVTLLHAPTGSAAGMAQVAARALECAMQKLRALGFDPARVTEGAALAPLGAPHPDAEAAMGRANDAIIHGAVAHLAVNLPEAEAGRLAEALPSSTSPDWGPPFAEVLAAAGGRFGAIDPGLFAPARVLVTAPTGETFAAGRVDRRRLRTLL
jgi:methenyltetrahydromethanopterin cyclohydrolase